MDLKECGAWRALGEGSWILAHIVGAIALANGTALAGQPLPRLAERLPAETYAVPLRVDGSWVWDAYRGIPTNRIVWGTNSLSLEVRRSAMPLFHILPRPMHVVSLQVSGNIRGGLNVVPSRQGEHGEDDFALRIGLVRSGGRRPTRLEQWLAPHWLRALQGRLAPGTGTDGVHFLCVGEDPASIGRRIRNPNTDLMVNEIVSCRHPDGRLEISHVFAQPEEVAALWVGADGDDTQSTFTVRIDHLALGLVEDPGFEGPPKGH